MKTSIGLDIVPPSVSCSDGDCAWHGQLPIRGRVFEGTVRSVKGHRILIIERSFNKFLAKYERYERRNSRLTAHKPDCMKAAEGDTVTIAECRPLSKTKHFVVVGVSQVAAKKTKKIKKK